MIVVPKIFVCSAVAADYLAPVVRAAESISPVREVYGLTQQRYRSLAGGGRCARWLLRWCMYVAYPLRLAWVALRSPRGAVLLVTSNVFFAPALAAKLASGRGGKVVHLLYDLFPDALEVAGALKPGGMAVRLLGAVARANLRGPAAVVFLGEFLRQHAEARWGKARISRVVDIGADTRAFASELTRLRARPLHVHYGGNLGHMHDADVLIDAVASACVAGGDSGAVYFSFRIGGAMAGKVTAALAGTSVDLGRTLPASDWRDLAQKAHVGFVTLSPGGATVCLPSKTYAMMAAGMAIVAIGPRTSDLAQLVLQSHAGWLVDSLDPVGRKRGTAEIAAEFSALVTRLARAPDEVEAKRRAAFQAAHVRYGFATLEARWHDVFAAIHAIPDSRHVSPDSVAVP